MLNINIKLRFMVVLCAALLLFGCGTIRLEVPEGYPVRLLAQNESAEIRVERTIWFWLWGGKAISDNSIKSDIEKYKLTEVRAYTVQTMTDNVLLIVTSFVSIVRRTLVVEGNTNAKTVIESVKEQKL
jgi:hypothetical protein